MDIEQRRAALAPDNDASGLQLKRKRQVRLDPYEPFALRREYRLTLTQWAVLLGLVLQADWRNREWTGSLTDLAQELGAGRTTVTKAVGALMTARCVEPITPFIQNKGGTLRVLVYDRLVVSGAATRSRVELAPDSRRNRVEIASIDASDQDFLASSRYKAIRDKGQREKNPSNRPNPQNHEMNPGEVPLDAEVLDALDPANYSTDEPPRDDDAEYERWVASTDEAER